jgi:hypothetical protein
LLLTDATVLCHEPSTNRWHRLSPDVHGSYATGTWDSPPVAPMPNGIDVPAGCPGPTGCTFAPEYFASAVLPDGKLVVIGGEYLNGQNVDANIGFLYDPTTNTWGPQLAEQFGHIGDSAGTVVSNGSFILPNQSFGSGANLEILNEATHAFTVLNPTGKHDGNTEEGRVNLPSGKLLVVDSQLANASELYDPSANTYVDAGATPVALSDTASLGGSLEVGPGVLRPDGTVVWFSANSLGQNAVYDSTSGVWSTSAAMSFPAVNGVAALNGCYGGLPYDAGADGAAPANFAVKDGPAALLPSGNVLVGASPADNVAGDFFEPTQFYALTPSNQLQRATDPAGAACLASYFGRMLVLPTGEVLYTSGQGSALLFSDGIAPSDAWRPVVTSAPASLAPGGTYTISGQLFNGVSEGASYGDDAQSATNYPLVRITNTATAHVFYARTHGHSRMGVVAPSSTQIVTTSFDVPAGIEGGAGTLVVVVNGIASHPVSVTVAGAAEPVPALPAAGNASLGLLLLAGGVASLAGAARRGKNARASAVVHA